jgi:hypothetical protein
VDVDLDPDGRAAMPSRVKVRAWRARRHARRPRRAWSRRSKIFGQLVRGMCAPRP